MRYTDVAVPLGAAWSSPFAKWQGTLAEVSEPRPRRRRHRRGRWPTAGSTPPSVRRLVLGWTVPQPDRVLRCADPGAPRLGMPGVSGPMIAQACATSVAALHAAAGAVSRRRRHATRRRRRPHQQRPAAGLPGTVRARAARPSPSTGCSTASPATRGPAQSMLATGETVAAERGFTRDELDDVTLLR